MNDVLLHEYVYQREAPIRERAARKAAQTGAAPAAALGSPDTKDAAHWRLVIPEQEPWVQHHAERSDEPIDMGSRER